MTDLISTYSQMLASPLMQRALIIAVLVGLSAPVIGTYLVQRGLALLGDGIGHIALTGVALGWIAGAAANVSPHDAWAIPGAIVVSIIGAILIEVIRAYGRTRGDVALAILFYGGIAGGVILIKLAGGTTTNLTSYLFGSIATVSVSDAWFAIALSAFILIVGLGLRGPLFALCHDEEFARSIGLPTGVLNMTIAVVAALTIAQLLSRSFIVTMRLSMGIGVVVCVTGLLITYVVSLSSGATIVVLLVGLYAVVAVGAALVRFLTRFARTRPTNARPDGTLVSAQETPGADHPAH